MSTKDEPPTREEIELQAHTLAMFLAGYGYAFTRKLCRALPPELAEPYLADVAWFSRQVDKLRRLNAQADATVQVGKTQGDK